MKRRPRWHDLKVILLLVFLQPCMAADATTRLLVGYVDLPPHVLAGVGSPGGLAPIYFSRITARMGVEVDYLRMPLARLLHMLERNELDAGLMLAKSDDRVKRIAYPSQPFLSTKQVVVVRQDGGISSFDQLRMEQRWKVGVALGGQHAPLVEQLGANPMLMSGEGATVRGLRMLMVGRLDAFLADQYAVAHQLRDVKMAKQLRLLSSPSNALHVYNVFSLHAAPRYLAAYEQALREVQAEQRYEALLAESLALP